MLSFVSVPYSVDMGGLLVAITHDALYLTVQAIPSSLEMGHGDPIPLALPHWY